jgi:hypothetical protein
MTFAFRVDELERIDAKTQNPAAEVQADRRGARRSGDGSFDDCIQV